MLHRRAKKRKLVALLTHIDGTPWRGEGTEGEPGGVCRVLRIADVLNSFIHSPLAVGYAWIRGPRWRSRTASEGLERRYARFRQRNFSYSPSPPTASRLSAATPHMRSGNRPSRPPAARRPRPRPGTAAPTGRYAAPPQALGMPAAASFLSKSVIGSTSLTPLSSSPSSSTCTTPVTYGDGAMMTVAAMKSAARPCTKIARARECERTWRGERRDETTQTRLGDVVHQHVLDAVLERHGRAAAPPVEADRRASSRL